MWTIDPRRSALLVIDMQNDFVREGAPMEVPAARPAIAPIRRLIDVGRPLDVPVIYTQHVLLDTFDVSPLESTYNPRLLTEGMRDGTPGIEVVDELAPETTDVRIRKHRYDAFYNTPLDSVLRSIRGLNSIDTVIVTGTLTEVCCESTARSAYMRDYRVAFVSDATGALSPEAQRATESVMGLCFARVLDSDTVVAELSR